MKKLVLNLFGAILCPLLLSAQSENLLKNYVESIRDVSSTFALNDQVNVLTVNKDNSNSEVSAVNNQLQVLWHIKILGYALVSGNFKGKIFVVAATERSTFKGLSNILDGFLLDPATGKVLLEKIVYQGEKDNIEVPSVFSAKDGSFLKLVVRQTDFTKKMHVGLPGPLVFLTLNKLDDDFRFTKDLTVIDYADNLDVASTVKPVLNGGVLFGINYNYNGSLFLSWSKGFGTIEVEKFDPGKKDRSAKINLQFDLRGNSESKNPESHFYVYPSISNQNVVYYAIAHNNLANDAQLSVAKVDFAAKTEQIVAEMLDKAALKKLQKAYVKMNKKLNSPHIGYNNDTDVEYMGEEGNNLLISMVNFHIETREYGATLVSKSPLINIYDLDLKLKTQQIFSSSFNVRYPTPSACYYLNNGKLYVVANDLDGVSSIRGLYGRLDIASGQWDKMEFLPTRQLAGTALCRYIMWYGNSFIAPYIHPLMLGIKMNLSLQWNPY